MGNVSAGLWHSALVTGVGACEPVARRARTPPTPRYLGFSGGRIVVAVTALPFKCPAAPYEAALLIDAVLRERGLRGASEMDVYTYPDGTRAAEGKVLSVESGVRLEMTFLPLCDPELTAEGAAREVWLLEDVGGATRLTVETYDITEGGKTHTDFVAGWPFIISGLKTLVETGRSLPMPGPDGG